jgi:hypothetical protein
MEKMRIESGDKQEKDKHSFVMPCNLKNYDVVNHFNKTNEIVWKKCAGIHTGDIVYIYVGIPVKAIKYRCVVINDDVRGELLEKNAYAKVGDFEHNHRYMQIRMINEYKDEIPLSKIKELGVYMIRKQGRIDRQLNDYLLEVNKVYDSKEN